MERTLNEDGRLMVTLAAIIVAGQQANPTMMNPSNTFQYNPQAAMNAAAGLIREALQFEQFCNSK